LVEEKPMSNLKKVLFSLIPVLLLFASVETGLWMTGFEPGTQKSDPYVGFAGEIPLFVEYEEKGRRMMRTASNKRDFFNDQRFPAKKSSNTRRVFCMGGSTTYGRPYRDITSFCAWLRASLELLAPETAWEVINAGGISYASYRVAALMEELATLEPDLFIVYTGHNEFLEERTYGSIKDDIQWLRKLELRLRRTRSWSAMESLVNRAGKSSIPSTDDTNGREQLPAEVETRLASSVGLNAYHRDDQLRSAVLEHFRLNLDRMATISREAGAEILYVVPADNLRDCAPFKSESSPTQSTTEAAALETLLEDANDALYREEFEDARALFSRAVELEPRHAHARYGLGRAFMALQDFEEARSELVTARDEDVCPLRALSAIPEIVREVAALRRAPIVDFPEVIAAAQEDALPPGADWFLDHVHPTIDGHRILASHLAQKVFDLGWLASDPGANRAALDTMERRILAGLDPAEHGVALRNLAKVLSWAGKNEDAARAARQALEALGDDAESFFVLSEYASSRHDSESAIGFLLEALRLDPDWAKARNNLGVQLMRLDRVEEALAAYDEALRYAPDHASSRFNRANALRRLGRLDESIVAYEECLRRDPEDLDVLFNIAGALEKTHEPERALEYLTRLLEIDPEDEDARRQAARLSSRRPSQDLSSERHS
jgi:tetratricopeptide (TPR) repeat protein